MALRTVLTSEEPRLRKHSREVVNFDGRLHQLLDDMLETLAEEDGVGLAAPQVGVLKRAVIVMETNVDEENGEEPYFIELINPEIISCEGEQRGSEGCLSVPEEYGIVTRPMKVTVRAQDRFGKEFTVSGEGLTARCFCHEVDHLEGILFTDLAERMLTREEIEAAAEKREAEEKEEQ